MENNSKIPPEMRSELYIIYHVIYIIYHILYILYFIYSKYVYVL